MNSPTPFFVLPVNRRRPCATGGLMSRADALRAPDAHIASSATAAVIVNDLLEATGDY
jgi:hypothetical protein